LERVSVVVPEEGLSRLTRRLLVPLGVAKAQVERLDVWALRLAERVFAERMPPLCEDAPGVVSSLKRHPALYRALEQRFAHLKPTALRFKRLRRQLAEAFTDRDFLRAVVNAAPHELRQSAVEETVRHCMLQLADPIKAELDSIVDPERKRALDGRDIAAGTPQELAGSIDLEDLPILLCVCAWHGKISLSPLSHLVLDEAEDFSFFELRVLRDLLAEPRSVTLAGDEVQRTHSSFAGWPAAQAVLGVQDARVCRLAVSYRCPEPVAELAHRVIAPLSEHAAPRAARSGVLVGHFHFPEPDQAQLFVANALRELLEREPAASAAIIAQEPERATRLFELLRDAPRARLVLDGEFSFEAGLDVTDVDNAKGLEFDYVIVPDADAASYPDTPEARHRLHVAITRAAHQLWLVSGGQRSALVASEPLTATSASRPGHRDHS
jgi:DNA helicase IV